MSKLTPQMIENAKQMIVNLEVAKTMDRKTNTRRLIKEIERLDANLYYTNRGRYYENEIIEYLSKYQAGDVYWIREPVQVTRCDDILRQYDYQFVADGKNVYQANIPPKYIVGQDRAIEANWIKNLHRVPNGCLKSMARTFVRITNVRVERLQDITLDDIQKEGLIHNESLLRNHGVTIENQLRRAWTLLWSSTAPKGYKWEDNPYVFVYEFERIGKEVGA